jgi:hypothetical protein
MTATLCPGERRSISEADYASLISTTAANNLQNRLIAATSRPGSKDLKDPAAWMSLHHYAYWLSYQPADRFWYFQAITGTALAALATAFALMTVRLARSRGYLLGSHRSSH